MANNKDVPKVWRSYGTGTGGYRRLEHMNARELADSEARQNAYDAMLARQEAYETRIKVESQTTLPPHYGLRIRQVLQLAERDHQLQQPLWFHTH